MTDRQTRKPMAAAIRTFVTGMKFPPAPEHGANPYIELAGFTVVMLQFAKGITEGCTEVTVSPAVTQVAEVIHGSDRTVKRRLKALRNLGLLTQKERGHNSTAYTFHQIPVAGTTVDLATAGTTIDTAEKSSGDNSAIQRGQLVGSAGTTRLPAGTTVAPLWSKASGSSLEKTPLGGDDCESGSGSTDNTGEHSKPTLEQMQLARRQKALARLRGAQ